VKTQAGVAACGVFAFLNIYATQPLLPLLAKLYGAPKVELGLTVSAVTVGMAISAPVFGLRTERSDRRRIIVGSMLLLSAVTLCVGLASNIPMLIVFRLLQGLILPGVFTSTVTYVNEEFATSESGRLMRLYVSGPSLEAFSAGWLQERRRICLIGGQVFTSWPELLLSVVFLSIKR